MEHSNLIFAPPSDQYHHRTNPRRLVYARKYRQEYRRFQMTLVYLIYTRFKSDKKL